MERGWGGVRDGGGAEWAGGAHWRRCQEATERRVSYAEEIQVGSHRIEEGEQGKASLWLEGMRWEEGGVADWVREGQAKGGGGEEDRGAGQWRGWQRQKDTCSSLFMDMMS